MAAKANPDWPVLTSYEGERLRCVALPLGGIGTGTVSLGGRGDLRDWEIVNRPAKGFQPRHAFFALWAKPKGEEAVARCLEGALLPPYEGSHGATQANHGLPRFRRCSFLAAYPFGQVLLADRDVPLDVRIEAFNPLIPADVERSSLPIAVLRFVLTNRKRSPVEAAVCGSLQNFIGSDGSRGKPRANVNRFRQGARVRGLLLSSEGVDPAAEQWGTIALTTTATRGLSHRAAWASLSWGDTLLDFWDDFSDDGRLNDRDPAGVDAPTASLAVRTRVPARGSRTLTFLLAWHFPNRQTWTPAEGGGQSAANTIGNHYATQYQDAWDVTEQTAAALQRLEADTVTFVRSFCDADLPPAVKEAALYNLSTLRTQTVFRTPDGRFYGWEGCSDAGGCCHGSCTHVWNYEHATGFVFGAIGQSMREVEFTHRTDARGLMSFRCNLPIDRAAEQGKAAADGQMGCLMRLYREWQLSGDDAFLRQLWPQAREALEFCWIPGGWDADRDGVMEGCQHNTMDVEYYGPNPQMGAWYLGALRACEEMARHVGEDDFASRCRELFEKGRAGLDADLFNGEYYEHRIVPPTGEVAEGLRHRMGAADATAPDFQLGAGCLVDQLVGQFTAHVLGLGDLLDRGHVRKTLRSIMRHNFQDDLTGHFNHLRSFALNGESALVMATYPRDRRPKRPFPYFNEVMTGFEYAAAVHMLYEGQVEAGLKCIRAIRARYDGARRNPFDEAECGHHYARAMASWAALLALTGFRYSAVEKTLTFAAADERTRWFWSTGYAWGTVEQRPLKRGIKVVLTVLHGTLRVKTLALAGVGSVDLPRGRKIAKGKTAILTIPRA
ncbi:MAG: GH116 family glycosyl-hydrolase [Planctomycetota bacterium]